MSKLITVFDDKEPLNNIVTVLSMDVDEVFYVYHHHTDESYFKNISQVITKYKDIKINFIELTDDVLQLSKIIADDVIIDVGGAKYLSLLLFDLFRDRNNLIVYYDDEENVIKEYRNHTVLDVEIIRLDIEDVLRLKGGEIKDTQHKPITNKTTKETIIRLVDSNIDKYNDFIRYITLVNSKISDKNYLGNITYSINKEDFNDLIKGNVYNETDSLFSLEDNKITFKNSDSKDMVNISGAILENYIYIKLKESGYFDDIRISSVIDFSDAKYTYPVRCEIDLLLIKNNHLLFVSCKSTKAITDDLNEIYVHNKMFGNCLSFPVLCVGEELDRKYPSIYAKAKEMGIYLIDKSSFVENDIVKQFKKIIEGKYIYD